jgi:hypothetical protein
MGTPGSTGDGGVTPEEALEKVLVSFFENSRDNTPDIRALVGLLRSEDVSLPPGFRTVLAEFLDGKLPGKLASNWQLRPVYVGRYDKEAEKEKKEQIVRSAMAACNVTEAMAKADGLSESTAWRVRREMQRNDFRAKLKKAFSQAYNMVEEHCHIVEKK